MLQRRRFPAAVVETVLQNWSARFTVEQIQVMVHDAHQMELRPLQVRAIVKKARDRRDPRAKPRNNAVYGRS